MLAEADRQKREWAAFAAVFFIALGLRAVLLGQHAFHMDEALYATWSRRILEGDLLLTGGLNNDKPPLQMYLGALGLAFFGESESAIRLMNALLSSLECALLAWALAPVAGLAAAAGSGLLLAAAPLHRSYGASGLMDGPLSFFMLLSFALAIRGKIRMSGLAWGLALCSKQTALFFLPLPVLAVVAARGCSKAHALDFARGASWVCFPLLLWSALFSHPRLGAFLGMAANQPEVGFQLEGLGPRFAGWLQWSGGALPWEKALPWLAWGGAAAAPLLAWRAPSRESRAWSLALLFPLYGMLVFSAMNMRFFDRYALPYAWALCTAPALLGLLFSAEGAARKVFGGLVFAIGIAAWLSARSRALPLDHQGVAGNGSDAYRSLLLDLKQSEPKGGVIFSSQGGIRPMGAWYLGPGWSMAEGDEQLPRDERPLYAAEREGSAPPRERRWRLIKSYDGVGPAPYWLLYKANGG